MPATGEVPPEFATVMELGTELRRGGFSALELTQAYLDRIATLDGTYHSYATVTADTALEEARRADEELRSGLDRGPLHGIPLGIKDLVDMAGTPTKAGMAVREHHLARQDATVITRLRHAGAVILGKLVLTEGASGHHHPSVPVPVNPWDSSRSAGFSSSGSGVAVAAGLCAAALGSDTAGSIRIPSAFNSVTGLMPSWGRVSRYGVFPLAEHMDTVGPMARSAADAAAILQAIAGADPADPTCVRLPVPSYALSAQSDISGVRIGIDWQRLESECDDEMLEALRHVVEMMSSRGARPCEIRMPQPGMEALFAYLLPAIAHAHRDTYPARAAEYGEALSFVLEGGRAVSGADFAGALNEINRLKGLYAGLFEDIDLLLMPAMPMKPPQAGWLESLVETDKAAAFRAFGYTMPFNAAGYPTITFPAGFAGHLPLGAQLAARPFREELLLKVAHVFQSLTAWHLRRPELMAAR